MIGKSKKVEAGKITEKQVARKAVRLILNGETLKTATLSEELRLRVLRLLLVTAGQKPENGVSVHSEMLSESVDPEIRILKCRFEEHPERHPGVKWAKVENALKAHPEELAALRKLEKARCEPDVLAETSHHFVLVGFSYQIPPDLRNLDRDEALGKAHEFGAKLIGKPNYRKMQKSDDFDKDCLCYLANDGRPDCSQAGYRKGGKVQFVKVCKQSKIGIRCELYVPKV